MLSKPKVIQEHINIYTCMYMYIYIYIYALLTMPDKLIIRMYVALPMKNSAVNMLCIIARTRVVI